MQPGNMVFIMADEHHRDVLGCAGHPLVKTPHLDALAASGTRFTDAYCNSPICVPSRASFATGRYVHQIRFWDNAMPYDGSVPSWGHRLQATGNPVVSIGKLHYRSAADANGFDTEIMPMHVIDGIGDLRGMIRRDMQPAMATLGLAKGAGRGDSSYQRYDDRITSASVDWLTRWADRPGEKPFALFVSLVCPHFPLMSRPEWYDMYPADKVPWPDQYGAHERPQHPWIVALRELQIYDKGFDPASVRRALSAYFGMVSFTDHNVGRIMAALRQTGLIDNTNVIYTSDHGDNLGARGLWGKSNLYDAAAAVPMIIAGPTVPHGAEVREPVSLVDCFPTIVEAVGSRLAPEDADLPGASLFDIIRGTHRRRHVLSEYHAVGATTGAFMIRVGNFKYIHFAGLPPQLFDLELDPREIRNLAEEPGYAGLVADCAARLRAIVDPDAADAQAHADQEARIELFGGRDAVLARGALGYTPAPGDNPEFA